MEIAYIGQEDHRYPSALSNYLCNSALKTLTAIGNIDILKHKKLALFCSVKCPGNLVLRALDFAQALRKARITIIGGFHSPMEREVLKTLLCSPHPVIICPARSINRMRLAKEYKRPIYENRLLLLSPFNEKHRRMTVETSNSRNEFVAALAEKVFVAYAAPGSKTEQFCRNVLGKGKPLFILETDENKVLLNLGAKPIKPATAEKLFFGTGG